MKSFKSLMESLAEAWPGTPEYKKKFGSPSADGPDGSRHKIDRTPGITRATRKYDTESGESEEPTKSREDAAAAPAKRGRGRPPGKYGSYKKKIKESLEILESLETDEEISEFVDSLDEESFAELEQYLSEEQGVAEADKHSFVGKIQRGHKLKKKVDSTFKDIGDAQKKGDKEAGSNAFRKHERYANLERPGTWTKSKEQGVGGGSKQQLPVVMYKEISPDMTQGREFFQVVQSQSPFWKVGDTFSDDDMSMGSRQVRFVSVEQGVAEGEEHIDELRNVTQDQLGGRMGSTRGLFNKTPAGKEREVKRRQEHLKGQMKFTKSQGGIAGPKGKLPEEVEQTDEAMSQQAKTTMKHVKNATPGEKKAAKDIKPGIAGYRDRIAMLKSAEARGGLKNEEAEVDEALKHPNHKVLDKNKNNKLDKEDFAILRGEKKAPMKEEVSEDQVANIAAFITKQSKGEA